MPGRFLMPIIRDDKFLLPCSLKRGILYKDLERTDGWGERQAAGSSEYTRSTGGLAV